MHPRRSGLDGRHRGGGRETEIVVAVPVDRDVVAEQLGRLPDEERGGLGCRDPERVDDDDLLRPRFDGGCVGALEEVELARGCRRRRRTPRGCRCAVANETALRIRSSIVSCETPSALSFPSEIGLSITEASTPSSTSASTSRLHGSREAPDLGAQTGPRDRLHGSVVVLGDAREPGLDPVDAGGVERARDLELVLGREHDPDRLLAVAQRRVVEADDDVRLRLERHPVQVARPDLSWSSVIGEPPSYKLSLAPSRRTIPSGNGLSFSGAPSVTSQLSSSRRPPPPSQ